MQEHSSWIFFSCIIVIGIKDGSHKWFTVRCRYLYQLRYFMIVKHLIALTDQLYIATVEHCRSGHMLCRALKESDTRTGLLRIEFYAFTAGKHHLFFCFQIYPTDMSSMGIANICSEKQGAPVPAQPIVFHNTLT